LARAFAEKEKTVIRQRLLEVGRDLFVRQGLKKTSLEQITNPLGIAKSSFYLFFQTKEDLYLELLMQERGQLQEQVMASTFHATDNMSEALVRFVQKVLQVIESNVLTHRLMTHPEEHALLTRYGSSASWAANTADAVKKVLPFIKEGQAKRTIVKEDPTLMIRALLTVPLVMLHREVIGESYPAVIEMLIKLLARGMTRDARLGEKGTKP
jgi:AcrR family transcriptional regulator